MGVTRRPIVTRKRLLIALLMIVGLIAAGWLFVLYPLARWGVRRALAASGLEPADFRIESVGLGTLRVADLSVGSEPWLTAAGVEVTFTLSGLLASRAEAFRLVNVRWTVQARDGAIDWGYMPAESAGPAMFDLPCDLIEVTDSVIRVVVNGAAHDLQLAGRLVPAGPGATQIDVDLALSSIAERAGGVEIALSQASVTGHLVLGEGELTSLTCSISAQGLRIGGLTLQTAELKAVKADGSALELEVAASGEGWELPAARGSLLWDTAGGRTEESPSSTILTAAMRTERPVLLDFESAGITGLVQSVTASARLQADESGVHVLDGRVTLDGGSLQAGDVALSDAHAELVMHHPGTFEVTLLTAIVGDGSTISAEPFTWELGTQHVQARLSMSNLSLTHWLPIITGNHATGEGRVSGNAIVAIDWSTGSAKLGELTGSLRADPAHGFIQATDADALGELLEKQDPRFATDEVMRPVRDKIIAALRDFAFKKLTVDFSRRGDRTIALTYLSGFGRHGDDPQGLNLTLDLQAQDAFVDLASRIAAKSRVNKAARTALEEFFQETPDVQEKR